MTKKGWLIVFSVVVLACMPYALFYGLLLYDLNASPHTDACIDDFFEAVEDRDYQNAISLFLSESVVDEEEQKEKISVAFSYVDGECKGSKKVDPLYSTRCEGGEEQFTTYEVKTKKDRYYVAIRILVAEQKAQSGISSLYIIRASEWDALHPDYPYRGDYMWTPGVHIGVLPS